MQPWLITFEPLSRDALCAYFCDTYGEDSFIILPDHLATDELIKSIASSRTSKKIAVVDLAKHLISITALLQHTNLIDHRFYVRPRLLQFPEGLSALAFPSNSASVDMRRIMVLCDLLLCKRAYVELEDFAFSPDIIVRALADWLGHDLAPATFRFGPKALGPAYAAIQALSRLTPPANLADLFPHRLEIPFQVGSGATLILQEGCSDPEASLIWSMGASSRIRIPTGSKETIARLSGSLIDNEIVIEATVGGMPSCTCVLSDHEGGRRVVLVLLQPSSQNYVDVILTYSKTVRPCDLIADNGDTRSLAFALSSLHLVERSAPQINCVNFDLSELVENDHDASIMTQSCLSVHQRDQWLSSALSWCADTARIMASKTLDETEHGVAAVSTVWQGNIRDFLRSVLSEGSWSLVVGSARLSEMLSETIDCEKIHQGAKIHFLVDLEHVTRPLLDWFHRHNLLFVAEESGITAVKL